MARMMAGGLEAPGPRKEGRGCVRGALTCGEGPKEPPHQGHPHQSHLSLSIYRER